MLIYTNWGSRQSYLGLLSDKITFILGYMLKGFGKSDQTQKVQTTALLIPLLATVEFMQLPMGIASALGIYHSIMLQIFADLDGMSNWLWSVDLKQKWSTSQWEFAQ